MSATGILQNATIITALVGAVGSEIGTENAEYLHLYLTYVKGDESGVTVKMFTARTAGGTAHQSRIWTVLSGVNTQAAESVYLTASGSYRFEWLLGAIDYVSFTEIADGGTPNGTLAASYALL
jgi:hypothetical protein